jgi:hypothetical protein
LGPVRPVPLDPARAVGLVVFVLVSPDDGVRLNSTGEPIVVDEFARSPPPAVAVFLSVLLFYHILLLFYFSFSSSIFKVLNPPLCIRSSEGTGIQSE